MLCGLLAPSGGELHVAGADVRKALRLGPRPARLCRAEVLAVRTVERHREPRVLRQRLRSARRTQARAHRLGDGAIRAGRARAGDQRDSCRAATSSASPWRPRCCTSRRFCSSMSRPAAPIRWRAALLAPHHRARRTGRDHHRHDALHAGGGVLRPHRDHGLPARCWRRARRPRCARWRAPPSGPNPAWTMPSSPWSSSRAIAAIGGRAASPAAA